MLKPAAVAAETACLTDAVDATTTPEMIIANYARRRASRNPISARALQLDVDAYLSLHREKYAAQCEDLPERRKHADRR